MRLGFTVEELAMAGRGGGALRMGLSRVAETEWLQRSFDRAARAAAFDRYPEAFRSLPGADAAGREVATMVGADGGLRAAARATWEDLCLLQPIGDEYILTAAAVAFPTDWRIEDKIGRPLAAIHAPIHGYADQLSAGVDHFFRSLQPGPIFGRANWFVVADDAWRYMPDGDPATRFAQVTPDTAGNTLFLRCERQTLRRLPESGAILFTIGIAVAALDTLSAALVRRVSSALSMGPDGEHARRAAPYYADALAAYAAVRDHEYLEAAA